jgi:hypothetical protein
MKNPPSAKRMSAEDFRYRQNFARLVDELIIGINKSEMAVRVQERDLELEHPGFQDVVRVQEADVISSGNFEPFVSCAGPATIFLVKVFDRAIKLANHFLC